MCGKHHQPFHIYHRHQYSFSIWRNGSAGILRMDRIKVNEKFPNTRNAREEEDEATVAYARRIIS